MASDAIPSRALSQDISDSGGERHFRSARRFASGLSRHRKVLITMPACHADEVLASRLHGADIGSLPLPAGGRRRHQSGEADAPDIAIAPREIHATSEMREGARSSAAHGAPLTLSQPQQSRRGRRAKNFKSQLRARHDSHSMTRAMPAIGAASSPSCRQIEAFSPWSGRRIRLIQATWC